jgi:two-component system sensor histidine kinase VicK
MAAVQIGPILQQVVSTFLPHAENKKIVLQLELSQSLPSIWANVMQLEQVITNLVNNALIYTPDMGHILVKAEQGLKNKLTMLQISVQDDGLGIPAEDLPQIFDRFFRSQRVEEEAIRGTGLGLAICKEIVERHDGFIEAKSKMGQGTVFTVWLPVEETTTVG